MRRCDDVHSRTGAEREDRRAAAGLLHRACVLVCAAALLLVPGGALRAFHMHYRSWAAPLQLAQGSLHTKPQVYIPASRRIPKLAIQQWGGLAKASVAAAVMMALVLHAQKDKFLVYAQENGAAVAFIVLLGSTVALAYNAVHNMLLKRTSSVAVRLHGSLSP